MVLLLAIGAGVLGIIISICGCFKTELVIELPSFRKELSDSFNRDDELNLDSSLNEDSSSISES